MRHFADWGANVIRIEPPATDGEDVAGRRHGFDFQNLHRNKRAVTLNLKTMEYGPRQKPKFASVEAARAVDDLPARPLRRSR